MICHYCGTSYEFEYGKFTVRSCPVCRHTPIDKTGAGNGLQSKPVTARQSGFPFGYKKSHKVQQTVITA